MQEQTLQTTKLFVDDHDYRGLPMPVIVKETKNHYFIEIDWSNPGFKDLYDDAKYYEDPRDFESDVRGYCLSAKALAKKMEATKDHESFERVDSQLWLWDTFDLWL
jgi:hypothetical protein